MKCKYSASFRKTPQEKVSWTMEFLLSLLGVWMIIEGIPWFLSPGGMKNALRQMLYLPDKSLRLMGAVLMFAGLLTVYLVRG